MVGQFPGQRAKKKIVMPLNNISLYTDQNVCPVNLHYPCRLNEPLQLFNLPIDKSLVCEILTKYTFQLLLALANKSLKHIIVVSFLAKRRKRAALR